MTAQRSHCGLVGHLVGNVAMVDDLQVIRLSRARVPATKWP